MPQVAPGSANCDASRGTRLTQKALQAVSASLSYVTLDPAPGQLLPE
jgi:hypothetical protein